MLSGLAQVREGTTDLLVPESYCKKGPGTKTGEVFYNKQMEFGRDISVMLGRVVFGEGQRILDGLAATGARGLRLANECGVRADFELNDRDLRAAVLMKQNAELNSLGHVRVNCRDLRSLLAEEQFDYIDIDPFGTPVDFIDSAVQSCRNNGVIAITATDTAPLYGTYPKTCFRRYGSTSARSPFAHETGLRILIGFVVREAAKHDRAAEPILCYHADHYFRCNLRIRSGAARADAAVKKLGFIDFTRSTLSRTAHTARASDKDAGPLWLLELSSKEVLKGMKATGDLGTSVRCGRILDVWKDEAGMPPLYYGMDELARKTKLAAPKLVEFIEYLRAEGARASKTHFDPKGLKTDLDASELLKHYRKYHKKR
ncbi:MAG: tRNA (guanine(26)-N(2))-dimethyltransferase [Candidatus Thermoplasmatota archaeon]|nr:tRNA (guanine(26)-N(2))-dimethyltransferase [Candidatus Thermoplasmatota archaeon]